MLNIQKGKKSKAIQSEGTLVVFLLIQEKSRQNQTKLEGRVPGEPWEIIVAPRYLINNSLLEEVEDIKDIGIFMTHTVSSQIS